MSKEQSLLQRLAEEMDLVGEPIPSQSLVELSGSNRVLIENHRGITQYSRTKICVKTTFGQIAVCGCTLELKQMTRQQLVIGGRIDTISVHRRDR